MVKEELADKWLLSLICQRFMVEGIQIIS